MLQEIITYIILALVLSGALYKIIRLFTRAGSNCKNCFMLKNNCELAKLKKNMP